MGTQTSPYFNDPNIGQAFNNLAGAFAPPSGADLAGYADARATKEKASRLAKLYLDALDPNFDRNTLDREAAVLGSYTPTQSWSAQDQNTATTRRGQDLTSETARLNNAADNARALKEREMVDIILRSNNADDNARALQQTQITDTTARRGQDLTSATTRRGQDLTAETSITNNQADNARALQTAILAPVGEGETRFVPPALAGQFNVPEQQIGVIAAKPGETLTLPDKRVIDGQPLALTEEQIKAKILAGLPSAEQRLAALGNTPTEVVVKDGKPTIQWRADAINQPAFEKSPSTVVNFDQAGNQLPPPGDGLAWARNPDNSVKLDERGAPIALPFQGGKLYEQRMKDAQAKDAKDQNAAAKNDIVIQDIDRVLSAVNANPNLTTGLGAQLTSSIGGMPARDVTALLDTIRANIGFEQLQAMRDASPTGGALGQVTEREQEYLQSVLGSLAETQSSGQLQDNLRRLRNAYMDTIHGKGNGPREKLSFEQDPAADPSA
jgi:hypothetical protein